VLRSPRFFSGAKSPTEGSGERSRRISISSQEWRRLHRFSQHDISGLTLSLRDGTYSIEGTLTSNIPGISRSPLHGSLEMTLWSSEPFPYLSLRGAHQGDVAISTQERRRLLRFARNDITRLGLWLVANFSYGQGIVTVVEYPNLLNTRRVPYEVVEQVFGSVMV